MGGTTASPRLDNAASFRGLRGGGLFCAYPIEPGWAVNRPSVIRLTTLNWKLRAFAIWLPLTIAILSPHSDTKAILALM
jgi:hypothetical protein